MKEEIQHAVVLALVSSGFSMLFSTGLVLPTAVAWLGAWVVGKM